jgi:HCOMODA/2-hydroxy-3-carboxy-muconic semialdehyde decarboxylase
MDGDRARAIKDLVIANRILANRGIVDAFGDVSVRHPAQTGRFLLARPVSPAVVAVDDVIEFCPDAGPVREDERRELPRERLLHAVVYEARPDVSAILHASPEDLLAFTITMTPLRPVIHSVGEMGLHVPVWDIAERFGQITDLEISTMEQARDLARCLGRNRTLLMRGHGIVIAGRTLNEVARLATYVPRNGRTITDSMKLGPIVGLSAGEVEARLALDPDSIAMRRGWEYYARQAGCGVLLID